MSGKIFEYHIHSDFSNPTTSIDSATKINMYIQRAKAEGFSALAFSEHGNIFNWATKKSMIEEAGMKYVHAIEFYMTKNIAEKVRDNYHIIAIAKNWDGVMEINKMVTISGNRKDNHFYYVPRITFEELKNTSNNIILTSACLGGPLNSNDEELEEEFIDFFQKNKDRCFLEIQHHNCIDQILYNRKLYEIHKNTGIRLIAGTDTHSLNKEMAEAREVLQKAKKVFFGNEQELDLTFKNYDELIAAYKAQSSLPMEIVEDAINNTCVVESMIEEFEIDKTAKYPKLYENSEEELRKKVYSAIETHKYASKNHTKKELYNRVDEELEVYKKANMVDFILFQSWVREKEHEQGIYVGPGRGSVTGSMVAYLLGITEMDSMRFNLNFFRFCNPQRVSLADVDSDYYDPDRKKARDFLLTYKGIKSAEICAFGTIALRGAIDDVGRALGYSLDEVATIKDSLKTDENKQEYADEILRKKYPEVFKYVDLLYGTIISVGTHPAGVLCATDDIESKIGLFTLSTTDHPVSSLDMYGLDAGWWTKLDCLGLDAVGLINETCKLAGIERITPDNIDLEDWEVWKDIRDDTTGIFQYESDFAKQVLKQLFSDETIEKIRKEYPNFSYLKLFSFGNALLRPCGASVRDDAIKGISKKTGIEEIDEMLAPELGNCIVQETFMRFVMRFCGYSLLDADKLRKGIAKKKGTQQFLSDIHDKFIVNSCKEFGITPERAEEIIKPILQCISDASRYSFSWNHADAYSFIGYACGWLRHYYPLEFISTCFNIWSDKEDKTKVVYEYAKKNKININNPKFRYSRAYYYMDKNTNSIYKGLYSVKFLNEDCAEYLFSLKDNKYKKFHDLLSDLDSKHINSRQTEILIKTDFFEEFGNSKFLYYVFKYNDLYKNAKSISKEKITNNIIKNIIYRHGRETSKKIMDLDNQKIMDEIEDFLKITISEDFDIITKISWQNEFFGYIDYKTGNTDDRTKLFIISCVPLKSKKTNSIWAYAAKTLSIGTGKMSEILIYKKVFDKNPIKENYIIKVDCNALVRKEFNGKYSWYLNYYKIDKM